MADWAEEAALAHMTRMGHVLSDGTPYQGQFAEMVADLRAAYERGVRDAADCCDDIHTARVAKLRILALLDKEGGGDG